jgi:hypothetical protein
VTEKYEFSPLLREFLGKCLCIEKNKRLEPYDLKKYRFSQKGTINNINNNATSVNMGNVLMETKSLNYQQKTSSTSFNPT